MPLILIIDDEEGVRDALGALLQWAGYQVVCASDGRRGLDLMRKRPADVVITDIFMPETEGLETIRQIRREFPKAKIIAMSGGGGGDLLSADEYLRIAAQLGACRTFVKPFDGERVLSAVREAIG